MRKSLVALLLLMGAAATLASTAFAREDGLRDELLPAKLINAQMNQEMRSAVVRTGTSAVGDTTYVGFVPGHVTTTNYWGIYKGAFRAYENAASSYGYWGFDDDPIHNNIAEVHGDSLFGWWPYRNIYNGTGGLTFPDDQRPWWAIDIGNNANYVINQGDGTNPNHPGVNLKRTWGVVGVWHRDEGNTGAGAGKRVGWTPLSGNFSLWAGLRQEGDLTEKDPITGNAFNAHLLANSGLAGGGQVNGGIGTNQNFPGYGSQWDQMAFRDLDVSGKPSVTVRFKFRTNMSTGRGTTPATQTGWFDKDPLKPPTANDGNFISSSASGLAAPVDSFMVYVGAAVNDAVGFVASSGGSPKPVYDPQRRWFSEVIAINHPYTEAFTTYGDNAAQTKTSLTVPVDASWNNKARVVFRSKTNRGFDDEGGSVPGAYSSLGQGAVVIDDVEVSYDGGSTYTTIGAFESAGDIDNSTSVNPLDAWKTTGKPPAIFHHVENIDDLVYQDLCGPVHNNPLRVCNLTGNVVSAGDHDNSEAAGGTVAGTAERERFDGMISPTINLMNGGAGSANEMGVNAFIASVTEDYYVEYSLYAGVFDFVNLGNAWRFGWSTWPARQSNVTGGGVKTWQDWRFPGFIIFNPDKQCFEDQEGALQFGLMAWDPNLAEGGASYPDSIRMYLGKLQECFRFGISTGCSPTDGCYWDNVTLAFVNGVAPPMSIDIWQFINDTFTVNGLNRNQVAPGTSAFDTTTALVKIGLNIAQTTGNTNRYAIPGDTTTINADGNSFRIDMVFRVSPGPGNYQTLGDRTSGLRLTPNAVGGPSASGTNGGVGGSQERNFWASYLNDNGGAGTPGGHPAPGTWSSLVWNSARCDTTETNIWPINSRNIGNPFIGTWSTMYHEFDPADPQNLSGDNRINRLGIQKNRCYLKDPAAAVNFANTTCDIGATLANWPVATGGLVPEITGQPAGQTYEYTKIMPDGQFTPGTHVEYFFRREDEVGSGGPCEGAANACLAPDTNIVFPQNSEGSTDAHRWQEFSVLPDKWKTYAGGLGQACMLYVDLNDRRGNERVWVSVADSIGATAAAKYGAHNGWHAVGKVDVNNPAGFVRNLNLQPGTTWDMFGVKASESLNSRAGTIGVDNSNHTATAVANKWSFIGPSLGMLEAYYKILMILSGDLNSAIVGPSTDFGANDVKMIEDFVRGGTPTDHRGLFVSGDGFVEAAAGTSPTSPQNDLIKNYLHATLRDVSYGVLTGNTNLCADLVALNPITTNGDIYGVRNGCLFTDDVLTPGARGVASSQYSPTLAAIPPVVSGVFHDVNAGANEYWQALTDGWDIENLRSRFCDKSLGRLAYYYNVFTNIFGKICPIQGVPVLTTDVPNNSEGATFVDFMKLGNNPVITGQAQVFLSLAKADRVEVKIFDVSGRLVRTLADRQFTAGPHTLTWDGLDNAGRQAQRGVYFTQVKYVNSRFADAKKLTVLK